MSAKNINNYDIDSSDVLAMFKETIGIMKSWSVQLTQQFPKDRFVIYASFDDGSAMIGDPKPSFTLRFWKIRPGQGHDQSIDSEQPVFMWVIE